MSRYYDKHTSHTANRCIGQFSASQFWRIWVKYSVNTFQVFFTSSLFTFCVFRPFFSFLSLIFLFLCFCFLSNCQFCLACVAKKWNPKHWAELEYYVSFPGMKEIVLQFCEITAINSHPAQETIYSQHTNSRFLLEIRQDETDSIVKGEYFFLPSTSAITWTLK